MSNREMYIQLINKFGKKSQVIVAIEELSELQKELCKYLRNEKNLENICEEMADVEIMLEQLKIIFFNTRTVQSIKQGKIKRTIKRYLELDQNNQGKDNKNEK